MILHKVGNILGSLVRVGKILFITLQAVWEGKAGLRGAISIKRAWALHMLDLVKVRIEMTGAPFVGGPAVYVGNHLSYLDIPLLMSQIPQVSFVAKAELESWPIFGKAMSAAGVVFVKRDSPSSRAAALKQLQIALAEGGKSVAIFPSGTTRLTEDSPWRPGAFRLAENAGIPIQAFRIRYRPARIAAFIDEDSFLAHLVRVCSCEGIVAEIEFAEPEMVSDFAVAMARWNSWCRAFVCDETGSDKVLPLADDASIYA